MLLLHEVFEGDEFRRIATRLTNLGTKSVAVTKRFLSFPESNHIGYYSTQHLNFALTQQATTVVKFRICNENFRSRRCVQTSNQHKLLNLPQTCDWLIFNAVELGYSICQFQTEHTRIHITRLIDTRSRNIRNRLNLVINCQNARKT